MCVRANAGRRTSPAVDASQGMMNQHSSSRSQMDGPPQPRKLPPGASHVSLQRAATVANVTQKEEELLQRFADAPRSQHMAAHRGQQDLKILKKGTVVLAAAMVGIGFMIIDEETMWETGPEFVYGVEYVEYTGVHAWDICIYASTAVLLLLLADLYWYMAGVLQARW